MKLNDEDIQIGASLVLNFLLKSDEEYIKYHTFSTPSNEKMTQHLDKFDLNMPQFTKIVNDEFKIIEGNLWEHYNFQEFFSGKISIDFFNMVLRQSKIKKLSNGINYKRKITFR